MTARHSTPTSPAITTTELAGLSLFRRGKVRDVYDLGDHLLIVATDRISAFDCIMPNGIPDKGRILTAMSLFWFELTGGIVDNHLVSASPDEYPRTARAHADLLRGRSMLVVKTAPYPVECVARGYLAGSGWKDYRATGSVCGIPLPPGLRQAERLPSPIFTPATKADSGHDENISFETAAERLGRTTAKRLRDLTLAIYGKARDYADGRGIIISDTKFEFGLAPDGRILLIDEVLTPDSSRFWDKAAYRVGTSPESFDKQYLRDYLESLDWDKTPPAPSLPPEVVAGTRQRYLDAYRLLTGREFIPG